MRPGRFRPGLWFEWYLRFHGMFPVLWSRLAVRELPASEARARGLGWDGFHLRPAGLGVMDFLHDIHAAVGLAQ